jgi:large subunit ribosomal protein L28
MSKVCDICDRGPASGNSRSHSNIASRRKHNLNLQQATYKGKRVKVCANCLKTITKKAKV